MVRAGAQSWGLSGQASYEGTWHCRSGQKKKEACGCLSPHTAQEELYLSVAASLVQCLRHVVEAWGQQQTHKTHRALLCTQWLLLVFPGAYRMRQKRLKR